MSSQDEAFIVMNEPASNQSPSARDRYTARLGELQALQKRLAERNQVFVILRTVIFFAAAILLCAGYIGAEPRGMLLTIGWIMAAAFLVAITAHEHLRLTDLKAARQTKLYERLLARLDRHWDKIRDLPSNVHEHSALADDLDLFGHASLWQLLALPSTGFGRRMLAEWLLEVPTWDVLQQRQTAVKELRSASVHREELLDRIATVSGAADDAMQLAHWASGPRWLPTHRIAHALSFIGPGLIALGAIVFWLATRVEEPDNTQLWISVIAIGAGFAINFLLTLGWGSWMHDIFLRVTGSNRDAQQLSEIFQAIGRLPGSSDMVTSLRHSASMGDDAAVPGFAKLLWRVRMANLQRDPIFYIVYLGLQLTMAWDFRVMESLERWQLRFGKSSAGWFDALGRCEALLAGATLSDEYPQWCFPEPCKDRQLIFEIESLGHPLLPDAQRVTNDLQLSRMQPLLLVTGSNMAGKSTLLRSLGLNQILARCGAPVCASSYRSPLFELATSIRVRDSLKEGVSFFMAELKRLKEVVDTAQMAGAQLQSEPAVMFLLDEILQGTNSRERQIAVIKVIERLLACNSVGAISTHDLELADQPAVTRVSQIVHFREYFENDAGVQRMRFDYVMRPGPTPTTNALKLLAMVGLDES